ncbi:MAG: hypothetical protein HN348_09365, partial [Proteobacteria bacterium]|nr:hypothetical protein [Pseudomonadota bacterium]
KGPKTRELKRIVLANGKMDLKPYLEGWVPTTEKTTFWVTNNPYGEALTHLKYLIRYPYGCIEQTTSSTRPLLFVSNLLPAVDPQLADPDRIDEMVMHGVDRVMAMQTPSGGFGYWPGSSSPNYWGTAYATHMLLDAKKLNYEVPEEGLEEALEFMENQLTYEDDEWGYNYRYSEPYYHYVLALANRGRKARIQSLINNLPANPKSSDAEAAYLLKASLYLLGDRRYEKDLRNPNVSALTGERKNDWTYYSDLRRRGFQLSIHQDLFSQSAGGDGEDLAQLVYNGLAKKRSYHYTTQEIMWGVTGLGKRVEQGSKSFKPATLIANGKELTADTRGKGTKRSDRMWSLVRASEYKTMVLSVPDVGDGTLYLLVNSEGIRQDATYEYGGNGLRLTRNYLNGDGAPLNLANHQLGDMVYAEIIVSNSSGERIQNIALVDRFPAGWEIENPRLGRGGDVDWMTDSAHETWDADYMNLRDDRLELFGALERGQSRRVVYALRAVTAGYFTVPPLEAEAMYDPSLWAREKGRSITIIGNWDEYFL